MKKTILFCISLIVSVMIYAQVNFTNPEKDFTVTFSEMPEYSASESGEGDEVIPIHNYLVMEGAEVLYMISLAVNPGGYVSEDTDLESILESTAGGFFQALDIKPETSKKVKSGKIQGRQYSGNNGTYFVTYQVFIHGEKLFQVVVMGISQDAPKKGVKTFFKSFKIL
jgi:hypothetical protein